jgi:hypothetical protein
VRGGGSSAGNSSIGHKKRICGMCQWDIVKTEEVMDTVWQFAGSPPELLHGPQRWESETWPETLRLQNNILVGGGTTSRSCATTQGVHEHGGVHVEDGLHWGAGAKLNPYKPSQHPTVLHCTYKLSILLVFLAV